MKNSFSIPVLPPYPWRSILAYLSLRCTPGLEVVGDDRYIRQTPAGTVAVEYDSSAHILRCLCEGPPGQPAQPDCAMRVRRLFDTERDPYEVERVLVRCPVLRPRVRKLTGLRVPGCWEPFELCLRVILGQQVSVPAAHTLMKRLAARCPDLTPDRVADTDLSTVGLTRSRLQTVQLLAERVANGSIRFDTQPWEEVASRLKEVPGIGPWTLQYLAIRLGRDADAFPETDLGLLRATGATKSRDLLQLAEAWRPYRAYAAMYLWAA